MSAANRPLDPEAHPDDVVAAAWIDGTLAPARRDQVEDHLSRCASCRLSLTALKLSAGDEGRDQEEPGDALRRRALGPQRAPARWLMPAAGLAASLVVLAGIWWLVGRPAPSEQAAIYRGHDDGLFRELTPTPGAVVSSDALRFAWAPVEGADRYSVLVTRPDATMVILFVVRPGEIPAHWPDKHPLPAAGDYLWSVRAHALDREIAVTRSIPFTLR